MNFPFKKVTIMGVGSFGGFFAESISRIKSLQTLIIIDYDIVKESNLKNSIYNKNDINKKKVLALKNIIKMHTNKDLNIVTIYDQISGKNINIFESDIVFDCRDYVGNKQEGINVKIYISGRHLIVDCKQEKTTRYFKYKGHYNENLTKFEIAAAAMHASYMIDKGSIMQLIDKNIIYKYDLDKLEKEISNMQGNDSVIDFDNYNNKILDLDDNYKEIIQKNEVTDLQIFTNSIKNPSKKSTVKKNTFKKYEDISENFENFLGSTLDIKKHSIKIETIESETFIILLPETGGA
jgi:hypothetical protein